MCCFFCLVSTADCHRCSYPGGLRAVFIQMGTLQVDFLSQAEAVSLWCSEACLTFRKALCSPHLRVYRASMAYGLHARSSVRRCSLNLTTPQLQTLSFISPDFHWKTLGDVGVWLLKKLKMCFCVYFASLRYDLPSKCWHLYKMCTCAEKML